jgi:predicted amidohydrolase YtcJ
VASERVRNRGSTNLLFKVRGFSIAINRDARNCSATSEFLEFEVRYPLMDKLSRRDFVQTLGAFAMLPLARTEPDLILYNGDIWSVDPALPRAQAVAISGGRFIAVGSNDEVLNLALPRTPKTDLGKKRVLPGFNDAHAHPSAAGVNHLRMVACDMNSIAAIQSALRKRATQTPADQWVLGFLYDDGKTPRPLSRQDLDEAVPDHPVMVGHRGGHTAFVNSRALALAGVNESTPDPPGGRFDHDPAGHLNGHVSDNAMALFTRLTAYKPTRDDYQKGVGLMARMMNGKGVTSVCDADAEPEDLQAYQDAREAGDLTTRIYCHITRSAIDRLIDAGIHTGLGDEWIRLGAVKLYTDGSISERTAWLSQDYIGISGYRGLQLGTRDEVYQIARKAHAAGWQVATHANGDLAIDEILGIYEQVHREVPRRDPRFRIEHCTLIDDALVARMRALGAIPVPFSGYIYFHGDVMHFYGEERTRHMFAMRTLLDAGLRPTDSSDYPASPSYPMMWLQSQLTRTDLNGKQWGLNQRITAQEAIRCGTLHGAYASYEETLKGSIEPGKLADLIVLDRDPLTADPSSLIQIAIERTMVGGKWVYEA